MGMNADHRTRMVKQWALEAGFDRCGVARAAPIGRSDYLTAWLAAGRAGSMSYLHRNLNIRLDPAQILPGARSAIVTALNYHQPNPARIEEAAGSGRVAMYAWGEDYHVVLRDKLRAVASRMRESLDEAFEARVCVDTAPIVERELAAAAGIGWIGKNTLVMHQDLGSYFFLGVIITTLELTPDEPSADHCGSCRACLDACPTQAFVAPYQMDASRCISYLTIEHRGDVAAPFAQPIGDWVFGCDVCQEVCPFNRDAPTTNEPRFAATRVAPTIELRELLDANDDALRARFRDSAMSRATPDMLRRNAGIVALNQGCNTGTLANQQP